MRRDGQPAGSRTSSRLGSRRGGSTAPPHALKGDGSGIPQDAGIKQEKQVIMEKNSQFNMSCSFNPSFLRSVSQPQVSSARLVGVDGAGGVHPSPSAHRWCWEETAAQLEQIIPVPGRALSSRR